MAINGAFCIPDFEYPFPSDVTKKMDQKITEKIQLTFSEGI